MTKLERSVLIERPIEDVWAFVHEPANDPKWQATIVEAHAPEEPLGVGTKIREVRRFLGRRFEMEYEVTEYEPHRRSAVRVTSGPIPGGGSYAFEPVNGGTRFSMTLEIDAHGFFRLAEPIFARAAHREMEANLGQLKDLLETGAAAP